MLYFIPINTQIVRKLVNNTLTSWDRENGSQEKTQHKHGSKNEKPKAENYEKGGGTTSQPSKSNIGSEEWHAV